MYSKSPKNRVPTDVENLVACPTCKAVRGAACTIAHFPAMGETTEIPHNKRALAAQHLASRT
jgi:hypothetical protein